MGFSLDMFFEELFTVLDSDMSAGKKLKFLVRVIRAAKEYARECGQLRD